MAESKVEVVPRHVFSVDESKKGGKSSGLVRRIRSAINSGEISYFQEFRDRHGAKFMAEAFNLVRSAMGEVEGVCPKCGETMRLHSKGVTSTALSAAKTILKHLADLPSHKVERVIHAEEFGQIALSAALEVYGRDKIVEFATILSEKLRQ